MLQASRWGFHLREWGPHRRRGAHPAIRLENRRARLAALSDITARKQAERQIAVYMRTLQSMNVERGRFNRTAVDRGLRMIQLH